MPESGSSISWASARWATMIAKVGGATRSLCPSAAAASTSKWAGWVALTARANSRIFSRPTSYTSAAG